MGKPDLAAQAEGRNPEPIMGDHRNPNNPWLDFKSSKSKRVRNKSGFGDFERPSKKKRY
ncbi:hypothetical protein MHBO_004221 [Bonamia ostreae]|uniref:Uncharacterized protein n=1 Tax=Bonamia ostreae TaxID=126728 RepID=A0ABV2ASR6_9EUKA